MAVSDPPPASSLTLDDLIRIFNDPEGELLQYPFKPRTGFSPQIDDVFHLDVPFDAIKRQVLPC